ncbi:MAG TPA: DUF1214 domain-containing protein [Woeseiaceae bacterium]|nr:DUF1214 domain-containing protein [Woeseiaceae bacterium]
MNADGFTTIYFGPTKPAAAKEGTWIQTTPGKGWFMICASIARSNHFSTRAGGRARSNW